MYNPCTLLCKDIPDPEYWLPQIHISCFIFMFGRPVVTLSTDFIFQEVACRCYHCHRKAGQPEEAVQHSITDHPDKPISILIRHNLPDNKSSFKSLHFNITPSLISCSPDNIIFDPSTMIIKVNHQYETLKTPPTCCNAAADCIKVALLLINRKYISVSGQIPCSALMW